MTQAELRKQVRLVYQKYAAISPDSYDVFRWCTVTHSWLDMEDLSKEELEIIKVRVSVLNKNFKELYKKSLDMHNVDPEFEELFKMGWRYE